MAIASCYVIPCRFSRRITLAWGIGAWHTARTDTRNSMDLISGEFFFINLFKRNWFLYPTAEGEAEDQSPTRVPPARVRCTCRALCSGTHCYYVSFYIYCYYDNTHLNSDFDCSNHRFLLFLFCFRRKERRRKKTRRKTSEGNSKSM